MNTVAKAMSNTADFVPLATRIGTFAGDFASAHAGRNIVIWGAGMLGRCLMRQLEPFIAPGQEYHFTDSNRELSGTVIDGHDVLDFNQALQRARDGSAYLLVALAGHLNSARAQLAEAGLKAGADYESYLMLSRPEAIIQVSGHDGDRVDHMTLDTFRSILAKLKTDVPDLFHVDLSGWSDPLDNPFLPDIIGATHPIAPCTVTTRLQAEPAHIERVLLAKPTQFVITADGYDASYRENTAGGNWDAFLDLLRFVSTAKARTAGQTEIRLKYNLFRNNQDDAGLMRALCQKLGIRMVQAIGYIDPYDTILELCEAAALDSAASRNLAWSLPEALDRAYADRARPCLCQRIFPVIHSDGSVGICHLYARQKLHQDYLSIDFSTLQRLRIGATHCRICQSHALHRLDIDVLQARHGIPL